MAPERRQFAHRGACLIALLIGGCTTTTNPPLIVAHRGLPGVHPDNSVVGLLAAADEGADGVELDVQLAADGTVVMAHDHDPACQDRKPEALAAFLTSEAGRFGHLFVELKGIDGNRQKLAEATVKTLVQHGVSDRTIITGFSADAVRWAQAAAANHNANQMTFGLHILVDGGLSTAAGCTPARADATEEDAQEMDVLWLLWPATTIDAADVRLAHARGKKVATWSTGENPAHIGTALRLGVDAIYSDVPKLARELSR